MTTEKKAEANRRNATKSTGPKSPEGKARSSQNAATHGLTAVSAIPVAGEAPDAYKESLERWVEDLAPTDLAQRALVERACRAAWKLDRCARIEDAEAAYSKRHAAADELLSEQVRAQELGRRLLFEPINRNAVVTREPHVVEALATRLADDPAVLAPMLQSFSEGTTWLLLRWGELLELLDRAESWHYPEKYAAIRMLGRRPEDFTSDPIGDRIVLLCNALHPEPWKLMDEAFQCTLGFVANPTYYLRVFALEETMPTSRKEALDELRAIVLTEMVRLAALKTNRLAPIAALDRASAADRAFFANPAKVALRLRYETAADRELRQSISDLAKLRKASEPPKPQPAAPQPAAPEPRRPEPLPAPKVPTTPPPVRKEATPTAAPVAVASREATSLQLKRHSRRSWSASQTA